MSGVISTFLGFVVLYVALFVASYIVFKEVVLCDRLKEHDLRKRGICCFKCKNTEFKSLTNHKNKFYCEKCYKNIKNEG